MDSSSSAIKIENVWKVFGNTSKAALDAIQNDNERLRRIATGKTSDVVTEDD